MKKVYEYIFYGFILIYIQYLYNEYLDILDKIIKLFLFFEVQALAKLIHFRLNGKETSNDGIKILCMGFCQIIASFTQTNGACTNKEILKNKMQFF